MVKGFKPKDFSKIEIQDNSCQTSLPFTLDAISKNVYPARKDCTLSKNLFSNLIVKKQDAQFFYRLCITVFALESDLKNYKNLSFLTDFRPQKLTLHTNTPEKSKDKAVLNLLRFYNFPFLLQSYVNRFSLNKKVTKIELKIFVGLLEAIKSSSVSAKNSNLNVWSLRRVFRKLQILDGLVGNSKFFHLKLLKIWYAYKGLPFSYQNIKEEQYYYYLRRLLDKNLAGGETVDADTATSYEQILLLLAQHKSQKYRLLRLKRALRQPLRHRTSRWALLPASYIKEKQRQAILDNLAETEEPLGEENNSPISN